MFEKAYCEYRLNRVESALKTIEGAPEQTDKLKELYGQVVMLFDLILMDTANLQLMKIIVQRLYGWTKTMFLVATVLTLYTQAYIRNAAYR